MVNLNVELWGEREYWKLVFEKIMDMDFQNILVMKDRRRKGLIAVLIVFPLGSGIPKNLIFLSYPPYNINSRKY